MRRTTLSRPLVCALLLLSAALLWPRDAAARPADPAAPPPTHGRASVRLDVTPKETQVYVDGYYAGMAEDFGGIFHRLRTRIGEHEITLYLEGYRTLTQQVRLGRSTYLIKHDMVRLAAGETSAKPPTVAPPSSPMPAPAPRDAYGRRRPMGPEPPPYGEPAPPYGDRGGDRNEPRGPRAAMRGGTIAIRVQPADAEVFVDGERWQGPDNTRLVIDVPEGTHRVEVTKEGFERYSVNVQVRRGETTTVNVSLMSSGSAAPSAKGL